MRLLVLCCMAILATTAAATTVSEVPDPRPASGIVDLAGVLDSDSTAAIAASISKAGLSGELMVVVVDSTGGVGARTWTTQLFNRLRIDAKARNRGVLLVAAVKDRKAVIVIGDGFNDDVTQITDRIMAESIVARFKRGDPRAAMVEGAAAIADKVITETAKPGDETVAPISSELASALAAATASPQMKRVVDPRPQRVLLDTAQLLKAKDAKALEAIVAARVATTIDLVVVTIKDIGTHDLEVFAQAVSAKLAVPSPSPSPPSSSSAETAVNDASDAIGSTPLSKDSVLVLAVAKTKAVIIVPGAGFPEYTTTLLRAAAPALPAQAKKQGVGGATRAAVDVVAEVAELIRTTEVQLAAVAAASAALASMLAVLACWVLVGSGCARPCVGGRASVESARSACTASTKRPMTSTSTPANSPKNASAPSTTTSGPAARVARCSRHDGGRSFPGIRGARAASAGRCRARRTRSSRRRSTRPGSRRSPRIAGSAATTGSRSARFRAGRSGRRRRRRRRAAAEAVVAGHHRVAAARARGDVPVTPRAAEVATAAVP